MTMQDPWNWTVEEVVRHLCESPDLYVHKLFRTRFPDFEQALHSHRIDGRQLLSSTDRTMVAMVSVGLQGYDMIGPMIRTIDGFRAVSPGYLEHLSATIRASNPSAMISHQPMIRLDAAVDSPQGRRSSLTPSNEIFHTPESRRPEHTSTRNTLPKRRINVTTTHSSNTFLGSKLAIDKIFFGENKTTPQHQTDANHHDDGSDDDDTPGDFVLLPTSSTHISTGKKAFVARRMRFLQRSTPQRPTKNKAVIQLYPQRLALSHDSKVMMITVQGDTATMSVRNSNDLEQSVSIEQDENNQWDWLVAKWKSTPDDQGLPVYNPAELEEDSDGSLEDEIQRDEAENEVAKRRQLSKETVEKLVEKYIETQTDDWEWTKRSKCQAKAYKLWHTTLGAGRQQQVALQKANILHLSARLGKIRQSIEEEVWTKEDLLLKQCEAMHQTCSDLSDARHLLKVLESSERPERPYTRSIAEPRATRKIGSDDEESLLSESDVDTLEDFIEHDEAADLAPPRRHRSPVIKPQDDNTAAHSHGMLSPDVPTREAQIIPISPSSAAGVISPSPEYEVIDLTASSPPVTPEKPRMTPQALSYDQDSENALPEELTDSYPHLSTDAQVRSWRWEDLQSNDDSRRLVMKIVLELEAKTRGAVFDRFRQLQYDVFRGEVKNSLETLASGRHKVLGLTEADSRIALINAKLWCSFRELDQRYARIAVPPHIVDVCRNLKGLNNLHEFMRDWDECRIHLPDEELVIPDKRGKGGKKVGKGNLKTKAVRQLLKSGQERIAEQEENKKLLSSANFDASVDIPVNLSKKEDEPFIMLNKHIAHVIKPHQVEGVQFMWRELIKSSEGCLLAHTMGLGKSMQTITLLVSIAEAAASPDPCVAEQIPEHLRFSRTLLLCPPGLIQNWVDEWNTWKPRDTVNVGEIYEVASKPLPHRIQDIRNWYESGGVLILGYETFRTMIVNKARINKKTEEIVHPMNEADHVRIKRWLLKGPNIVVADEAHKLKNQTSAVSQIAQDFQTTSRIALTGSPLANNLQEYHAMIRWVAPDFLSDAEWFRWYYQTPIEEGILADSTKAQQRRSLTKLKTLMRDIEPKVQRASYQAVAADLKQKTEFVLNIGLTPLQIKAYRTFIDSLRNNMGDDIASVRLFQWLSILGLLCGHPSVYWAKLQERDSKKAERIGKKAQAQAPTRDREDASPEVGEIGLPHNTFIRAQALLQEVDNLNDISHSYKLRLIHDILVESRKLNDRVLIFTHSIPMLNLLQRHIKTHLPTLRTGRLDGSTPMPERLRLAKATNAGEYDVLIISTTAGGLGLNIPGANRVILVDFSWNPSWEEQAVGRAYRLGQQKPVFVYHLVTAGTFEESLHQITVFKQQLAQRVVDKKNPTRSAVKVREMLFDPREVEQEDLSENIGLDPVLDVLLQKEDSGIRSIKTTDTLHREMKEELTPEEEAEVIKALEERRKRPVPGPVTGPVAVPMMAPMMVPMPGASSGTQDVANRMITERLREAIGRANGL